MTKTVLHVEPKASERLLDRLIPNATIFALGVVLTEIILGIALEEMRVPEDSIGLTDEHNTLIDHSTAIRLIGTVYSEAGIRYGDAVRQCLRCDFDQRATDLNDDSFRQAVYGGVVAPFEDDFKDFYQI